MKIIGIVILLAGTLLVWACDDANTAPPQNASGQTAASGSATEEHKSPSELHPRQFSP